MPGPPSCSYKGSVPQAVTHVTSRGVASRSVPPDRLGRSVREWDERYAGGGAPAEPSSTVLAALAGLAPGRALDLAAGAGRHALELSARGWSVTAVDSSARAVELGQRRAAERGLPGARSPDWVVADVHRWEPPQPADLVLVAYVQLGVPGLRRVAGWVAPGGHLVVVGHAAGGPSAGRPGPRDPALRHTPEDLRAGAAGLRVERLEEVPRSGDGSVDLLLVARRA